MQGDTPKATSYKPTAAAPRGRQVFRCITSIRDDFKVILDGGLEPIQCDCSLFELKQTFCPISSLPTDYNCYDIILSDDEVDQVSYSQSPIQDHFQ